MLISKVPDNEGGKGEGLAVPDEENDSHEYQTANELFELMAKNQNFDTSDVDKLTTRDLVLLYKNIDLGTKLMSNANELKRRKPNQHVESVVHNDEPESDGSDVSDVYSNEDLHNVFLINKERIDLLVTPPSVENTLCHKLGDLEIQTSDLTTEYDKHFLFKDPYIKDQLKSLKLMNTMNNSEVEGTLLSASLLDYICCKRLEDNYNFYMDNIIRYVKHTIEQLKRISNGDYLTDKAKEKWREVDNISQDPHSNTKVLANSTSIPLHVERKIGGRKSTWDDIVHSAVDIRSLSKILEKKIVLEVPKILCGSYKLLSKCCTDNVIISCKKEKRPVEENNPESRVDVVFKLQRSEKGQVVSHISSIMILQTAPVAACDTNEGKFTIPLPLSYQKATNNEIKTVGSNVKIMELDEMHMIDNLKEKSYDSECSDLAMEDPFMDSIDFGGSDNDGTASLKNSSLQESSDSSDALKDILDRKLMFAHREASSDVFPDDLRLTIRKLTMQSALTEESGEDISQSTTMKKKQSPTRVRIKSPYENQSHVMEEKKRRKLLEIRERRERKKMALAENCKITKHKYGKGAIMPQSASSVTKLSISNKSFYNSIYGQSTNVDPSKQPKGRNRKGGKRDTLDIGLESLNGEHEPTLSSQEKNCKKYTNRSYYLDDAVTEMMYINMKRSESDGKDLCSTSTSIISNDFRNNLNLLSQLLGPSETELDIGNDEITIESKTKMLDVAANDDNINGSFPEVVLASKAMLNMVPSNTPNLEHDNNGQKKPTSSVECRKSIDKIYTLMKNLGKAETESKSSKSKSVSNTADKAHTHGGQTNSTFQSSDSGTSLKHRLTSSNPSNFSFYKNTSDVFKATITLQNPGSPTAVVPKVIISSKSSLQTQKIESDKNKKVIRKTIVSPITKIPENPLQAISQLLHEFENVQKTRQKPSMEQKTLKKPEIICSDGKSGSRHSSLRRRSRFDQHNEGQGERYVRVTTPKERKNRLHAGMDNSKIPYQQSPVDDKNVEKNPKKKITDMLDEVKEARGEAVRGPSKLNSRLNSLAQPKRTYVQAHSEEYQIKYGKTVMADRLQRLAAAPPPPAPDRNIGSAISRNKKRSGNEAMSTVSVKPPPPPVPPLDRAVRTRHSTSCSPEVKERLNLGMGPSFKQVTVPETPQTLKKKMVAVESYVKNHYGRITSAVVIEPMSAQKSRVPLVPNDIELASTISYPSGEESTELGSRLHHIINSIIKTSSQGLEVLAECQESNSKLSKVNTDDYCLPENSSRSERVSSESDYTLDILDDNNVITSVENIDKAPVNEKKQINSNMVDASQYKVQPFRSDTEIEKLEHALCNHIPVGTFQKRLRIKNLTLTPKQSMQQVFVLQSGDVGSLVVQAPVKHSFKETKADKFSDLKALPVLSKSHLDWGFGNFPLQVSTVGYAFPEYKSIKCGSTSLVQLFDEVSKSSEDEKPLFETDTSDKDNQCFKGGRSHHILEQAAQANVPESYSKLVTVGISSTHIIESGRKGEEKQCEVSNEDPKHVLIDSSLKKAVKDPLKVEQILTNTNKCNVNLSNIKGETTKPVENKDSSSTATKPEDIEYTTSLDILVGLLNEIKKITTCQTLMTNDDKKEHESKELETILNKAAALENSMSPCDVISFTSLDKLRQLESNPSIYSFYLSDNEGSEKNNSKMNFPKELLPFKTEPFCSKPISADKEVNVDLIQKEYVNRFTDAPTRVFPIVMNHSTNVTNSLIGVLSESSSKSMFSLAEYHSLYSNPSTLGHKSLDVPQIIITEESNQPPALYKVNNQAMESPNENYNQSLKFYEVTDQTIEKANENYNQSLKFYEVTDQTIEKANENNNQSLKFYEVTNQAFEKVNENNNRTSLTFYEVNNQAITNPNTNKSYKKKQSFEKDRFTKNGNLKKGEFCLKTDFDPIMKMKRDILVTVYSILVFTVFAALSFPEIMYRV